MFELKEENNLLVCQYNGFDQLDLNIVFKNITEELMSLGFPRISSHGYVGSVFRKNIGSKTIEIISDYDGYSDGVGMVLFGVYIEAQTQEANPYILEVFEKLSIT